MNIVITNDAQKIAGGENYVLYLARGLREKGHKIYIAPLDNSELFELSKSEAFDVFGIPYGKNGNEIKAVKKFLKFTRDLNIDIVHSNSNTDRTIAAISGRLIKAVNFTSIHLCMSIRRNLTHFIRNKYLIDYFTPVGLETKLILMQKDRIPEKKISVINIGLPKNKFVFMPDARKNLREEFNIADNEIVVGTVSRLVEFKGHQYLLEAFAQLNRSIHKIKLIIVGEGNLKENLIALSKKLNILDNVIFTGARKDIPELLSAMDLFAQPSKDFGGESFPVSILEAMSIGLPILASNVGDIKYMIDSKCGFVVRPESVSDILNVMTKISKSEIDLKMLGINSRERFVQNFTIDKMIDNMESLYLKVKKQVG
jgi:glycosyltransferase involved in cell wall biosynthesis